MNNIKVSIQVDRAIKFAVRHHGSKKYANQISYWWHLADVARLVADYGCHDDVITAAWLHDIVEDTEVMFTDLRDLFNSNVVNLVWMVTDEPGPNRTVRKIRTYSKMKNNVDAVTLKVFDRIANVNACAEYDVKHKFQMYYDEHADFVHYLNLANHPNLLRLLNQSMKNACEHFEYPIDNIIVDSQI